MSQFSWNCPQFPEFTSIFRLGAFVLGVPLPGLPLHSVGMESILSFKVWLNCYYL